jgi:hypothetical protein
MIVLAFFPTNLGASASELVVLPARFSSIGTETGLLFGLSPESSTKGCRCDGSGSRGLSLLCLPPSRC